MIDKPLYGNPLAGGALLRPQENQLQGDALVEQMQMRMQQRDQKTPSFLAYFKDVMNTKGYPNKTMQDYESQFPNPLTERIVTQEDGMNLSGSNVPLGMFNVTPPSTPVSEQTPLPGIIDDPFKPKSDDPLMQGYYDSDFYSNTMTMDMVPYTYDGKEMMGSSSGASNLKKYLESIGKGNLLQFKNNNLMKQEGLSQVDTPEQLIESGQFTPGIGQDIFGNNPAEIAVPSTPNPIQGIGLDSAPINSYNRVGQQLTGPNQDDILGTLKNIEQGIMSLGQGNMNQSSFGGFNNNFGIGSFFPPYGGMYGK